MHMLNKIRTRARILAAYLRREERLRGVSFAEAVHSAFQVYGLKKWMLKRRVNIEEDGELSRFTLEGRTVYWPGVAEIDRLVDMYFEVNCDNPHRFDRGPTPVAPGDIVFDIGCCEGFFALQALEHGAARVFCFEPGRVACRTLTKTFERQIIEGRVEIVGSLLGETSGEMVFKENPADPSLGAATPNAVEMNENSYRVPLTTLDAFTDEMGLKRVDFLKVDVEAYELEVLRGGASMIAKYHPKIAIAAYHRPDHALEIRKLLSEINPRYKFKVNGLVEFNGVVRPVMLHCYL